MEARRPDVILLANGAVVVLECKTKASPIQPDLDQASAGWGSRCCAGVAAERIMDDWL